ncbi:MAG: hypothetical protein IT448_08690 [Phycisphaerales bacterium]|nr:hypothetical protein [Phycisphaerales bacterium]
MSANRQWRLILGVTVTVLLICIAVYLNGNNTRIDRQATILLQQAQTAMHSGDKPATAATVRDWLLQNGWYIATSPQGDWVSAFYGRDAGPSDPPEYLLIRGYFRLGTDDYIPGDRWISLTFRLNPDQTFQSLHLDRNAPQPTGWRRGATQQSF